MKHCERCGGAIMRANTAYAYAGPVCSCVWQQPMVEAARPTDEDKAKWLGLALMEAQKLREENERLRALCTTVHDRLLRGDDDRELLEVLEQHGSLRPTPASAEARQGRRLEAIVRTAAVNVENR